MRKFLLAAIFGVSLAGMIAAQAITGEKAETVKKEILKIEDVKVAGLLRGGSDKGDELNPNVPPNISAFDPATGKKEWTFNTKYYNMSSLLATAGDLIFGGDLEGNVFALDARTGQKLWSFNTGGRIASAAVSYSVNGRQYIAVGSGRGSEKEGRLAKIYPEAAAHLAQPASTLFVFALPEKGK